MLLVIRGHVAQGIDTDQAPDDPDNEGHDQGELIDEEIGHDALHQRCTPLLEIDEKACLEQDQEDREVLAVFDPQINEEDRDRISTKNIASEIASYPMGQKSGPDEGVTKRREMEAQR